MTDLKPRLFTTDGEVRCIGLSLLDRSLPRGDWTHEAHLAACHWIVTERPDIVPLPPVIIASQLLPVICRENR